MKGLLLVNLGSPKDLEDRSIKEYLSEFLSDDLVVDYPKVIQQILKSFLYSNIAALFEHIKVHATFILTHL